MISLQIVEQQAGFPRFSKSPATSMLLANQALMCSSHFLFPGSQLRKMLKELHGLATYIHWSLRAMKVSLDDCLKVRR
jgi:hypothetical protein